MFDLIEIAGVRVLACNADGAKIGSDRDASDLLGECLGSGARLVVIPVGRLHDDFFKLRTGMAGAFVQKFVNYQRRLAVVGDVSRFIEQSTAFRDFVVEANRGTQLWFVADRDELAKRLAA
jgi:hypothetical protein